MQSAFETIETSQMSIACDGGHLGHPRVWLHLDPQSHAVTCPYCSRHYVLKGKARPAADNLLRGAEQGSDMNSLSGPTHPGGTPGSNPA